MIDGTIVNVIPPLVAAILTYVIASKRARIQHAKLLADMQNQAIDQVTKSEEKMRQEIWNELEKMRDRNKELERNHSDMLNKMNIDKDLIDTLHDQIASLESINRNLQTDLKLKG